MSEKAQAGSPEACFKVGNVVDVKGHGRATIIEEPPTDPSAEHHGRYLVRYHEDDTTYWCKPKLLRQMHPTRKRVLVARHTHAYRDAMVHNIERKDVCLEIGCHEGLTTNIISNRATFVTGVDTAPEVVRIASERHPHLAFHVLDGLDVAATRALAPPGAGDYTRICIDISGKAPLELICQMIVAQSAAFPCASLIVKNEQLYDALALALAHAPGCDPGPCHPPPPPHERPPRAAPAAAAAQPGESPQAGGAAEAAPAAHSGASAPCGGATDAAAGPAAAEAAEAAAARLAALLGPELLAECELFRHQFRPPRTRPVRARGAKPGEQQEQQPQRREQQQQQHLARQPEQQGGQGHGS